MAAETRHGGGGLHFFGALYVDLTDVNSFYARTSEKHVEYQCACPGCSVTGINITSRAFI